MRFVKTQHLAKMCCVHFNLVPFLLINSLMESGRKTKYGAQDKLYSRVAEVQIKSSMRYRDTSNEMENIPDITLALRKKLLHLKEEMFLLQKSEWEVTQKSLRTLSIPLSTRNKWSFCYLLVIVCFISMVLKIKALQQIKCFFEIVIFFRNFFTFSGRLLVSQYPFPPNFSPLNYSIE